MSTDLTGPGSDSPEVFTPSRWSQAGRYFVSVPGLITTLVVIVMVAGAFFAGTLVGSGKTPTTAALDASAGPLATSPAATATTSPTATSSNPAPIGTGSPSPTVVTPSESPTGSFGTNLSALRPLQMTSVRDYVAGPEQIGTTVYPNSIRFTCTGAPGSVVFNVAGTKYLNAVLGIPNDASNAAGNSMSVTFFKDSITPTGQLGPAYTIALDRPHSIHLDLQGTSQIVIACAGTNASHQTVWMDMVLGNATISNS